MNRDRLQQIPINRHGNSGVELSYTVPVEDYPGSYHLVCYCGFVTKHAYTDIHSMKQTLEEMEDHARTFGTTTWSAFSH